ncbi:MAG: hypothetical protein C0514_06855 [Candidatus Puniceispirillum sp.]|nr:hypothetical protein [Candidatus Puniceispirillum sp.]
MPLALMGISVLATASAHASHNADIVEAQCTQTFIRVIEDGDPMNEEKPQCSPIAALPVEVMDHIFSFLSPHLSPQEMARGRELCSLWCNLLEGTHGKTISHSHVLFDAAPLRDTSSIPDEEMAQILALHMKHNGFAPLQNVYISPNQYPKGTRLLSASDLLWRQDTLDAWYWALFKQNPQDPHALALVMSALPQILVEDKTSPQTLDRITSYVKRVGQATRFVRFTGDESQEDLEALKATAHTFVVRADDLQKHKDALNTLLARDDHRVILSLDGEAFLEGGVRDIFRKGAVLTILNGDIPENLHHLTLSDPFAQVAFIGPYFLSGPLNLSSVDTRGLTSLGFIGHSFLAGCTNLTSFDTRGLASLRSIGSAFLYNCKNLRSFDTKPLTQVKVVQSSFLDETGLSLAGKASVHMFLAHVRQNTAAGA